MGTASPSPPSVDRSVPVQVAGDGANDADPEEGDPAKSWELAQQWSATWRTIKWAVTALVGLSAAMVIGQGYLFYGLFADIHPWLGYSFVIALTVALVFLVGRPLLGFFRTPVMAIAPQETVDPIDPDPAILARRLRYDLKYLKGLRRNPALKADRAAIDAGLKSGRTLLARANVVRGEAARALLADIQAFEAAEIDARLKAIDREVDKVIRAEAVGVGVATAVSLNGTVDAFIVLWRNANLVSRISRMYFGRPHLGGSLLILRDVAAIVVISRALEDVTDITGDVIGGLLGRMGGLVAGPIMDGAVNATMTLKLGYLAKRRCRSFQAWAPEQARSISADALERVKSESSAVIGDLIKRCGGLTASAASAAEKAMAGSRTTWSMIRSWLGPTGA